jgi:hypothetical protein
VLPFFNNIDVISFEALLVENLIEGDFEFLEVVAESFNLPKGPTLEEGQLGDK